MFLDYYKNTENEKNRQAYEKFLAEHPYNNRPNMSRSEWKKIPKADRPDLAIEQNFLMTMDPALKTIPIERLFKAYQIKEEKLKFKASPVSWREHGPVNIGGRTRAVMFDPNDGTNRKVWAGGVAGGLWYTDDITASSPQWTKIDDFWDNIAASCIAYDPADNQVFYLGTGEGYFNADAVQGGGIWKTEDGGSSWARLNSTTGSDFYYVQKIVVNSTGVYAATRNNGVMRSTNDGTSWSQVLGAGNGASTDRAADLEISADGTIYAAMGIFSTDGVYSSSDGTSWTQLNTGSNGFPTSGFYRIELAVAPSNANVVYALVQGTGYTISALYRTSNAGSSWTTITSPANVDGNSFAKSQAWYNLIAVVHPTDVNTVIAGGVDLFKTTNGGTSWDQISHWYGGYSLPYVHADQHAIQYRPGASDEIVFGSDGGIFYSIDGAD
ncbi:MAG: hypothetical protein KAR38_03085, partial [Calditrichia bacterium]|nr:hypothetical protein [Calditrichia bacterium]